MDTLATHNLFREWRGQSYFNDRTFSGFNSYRADAVNTYEGMNIATK